ncbi:phosphatases II [Fomes fomentarius]|nr:phosphatases II [Fomes fomentarius]
MRINRDDVVTLGCNTPANLLSASRSPPRADTVVSMLRSLTVDGDYFHRRQLRNACIQRSPLDDFFPQASEIAPGLFVCDLYTATSPAVLRQLGVTHVVSVMRKPSYRYPRPIEHLCVPVDDHSDNNLLDYLDYTVRWIQTALSRADGCVIIHCVWGMSRSASVAAAYLVSAQCMTVNEAIRAIRARRRIVRPNSGFVAQLQVYERVTRLREAQQSRTREQTAEGRGGADLDLGALAPSCWGPGTACRHEPRS